MNRVAAYRNASSEVTSVIRPKEIRKAAGVSLVAAAVHAGVNEATARVFEADEEAVNDSSRAKLRAFYATLAEKPGRSTPPPERAVAAEGR